MTGVLIRRGEETRRPKEDPVKMKTEIGVLQPQSKEQLGQQGAGRDKEEFSPEPLKQCGPAPTP